MYVAIRVRVKTEGDEIMEAPIDLFQQVLHCGGVFNFKMRKENVTGCNLCLVVSRVFSEYVFLLMVNIFNFVYFSKVLERERGSMEPLKEAEKKDLELGECSVCLEPIKDACTLDSCAHKFCYACIFKWANIKQECPYCKIKFQSITRLVNFIVEITLIEYKPSGYNIDRVRYWGGLRRLRRQLFIDYL